MVEIKSPASFDNADAPLLFLGGSIEMGKAEPWQERIVDDLYDQNVVLLNPRRTDWDSSWVQSIDNPQFKEQVEWELSALEKSDLIIFYFDPKTQSPVTLLELGLFAHKAVVYCPDGFWRKGNVDIVCDRYNAKTVNSYEELIEAILHKLKQC